MWLDLVSELGHGRADEPAPQPSPLSPTHKFQILGP